MPVLVDESSDCLKSVDESNTACFIAVINNEKERIMGSEKAQSKIDKRLEELREEQKRLERKKKELERDFHCDLGRLMQQVIGALDAKTKEMAKAIYAKHDMVFDAKG